LGCDPFVVWFVSWLDDVVGAVWSRVQVICSRVWLLCRAFSDVGRRGLCGVCVASCAGKSARLRVRFSFFLVALVSQLSHWLR